jgi:hypothetical protein
MLQIDGQPADERSRNLGVARQLFGKRFGKAASMKAPIMAPALLWYEFPYFVARPRKKVRQNGHACSIA